MLLPHELVDRHCILMLLHWWLLSISFKCLFVLFGLSSCLFLLFDYSYHRCLHTKNLIRQWNWHLFGLILILLYDFMCCHLEESFTCCFSFYAHKCVCFEFEVDRLFSQWIFITVELKLNLFEVLLGHKYTSNDRLVSEYFVKVLDIIQLDGTSFQAWLKCFCQCFNNEAIQLIAIVSYHTVTPSSWLCSFFNHPCITSSANSECMGTNLVPAELSLHNNRLWIAYLTISQ